MMYLDVTGGCTLPLQSGIPRTTRELYRLARERLPELMPIRWQPFRGAYTRLSLRASALLENRLDERTALSRPPRDTTGPLMLAAARDLASWPGAVPLHRALGAADTLLVTSLFPDNRMGYLDKLATAPGRKIALFHDAIPLRDSNVPAWEKKHHLRALRLLARFDLVIAVSDAAREDLLALAAENGIPSPRTTVIRWPVPFAGARPAFVPPPTNSKTILYVSRLKQVKNHAALLSACELLWREGRSFSLSLIGCEDEPRESAAILREIERLKAEGRALSWRAQVSEDELHAAYRAASFTAFPSRREGFGLPILESFWHGRGVICSGADAMGEVSRGPGAIHVDVSRPEEIAAAMRGLLDDDAVCLTLARAAHARQLRSWDDYWNELAPCLAA
jgi:glycosyltransferase involved in cell wall biosynthesis